MQTFAENKRRGFGHFLDREQLARMENESVASALEQVNGVRYSRGPQGQSWVVSSRPPRSHCNLSDLQCIRAEGLLYIPDASEAVLGVSIACYAKVYLGNMLANPGRPTSPFDLRSVPVSQVESLEWYTDNAQTPPEYFSRSSECGVLVIHTRR